MLKSPANPVPAEGAGSRAVWTRRFRILGTRVPCYTERVPRLTFEPFGVTVDCADGETIFAAARRAEVPVPTACVGKATCGLCRIKVLAGAEHLSPLNADEKKHLGNTYFITKLRLSCQARVSGGDVTVLLPDAKKR